VLAKANQLILLTSNKKSLREHPRPKIGSLPAWLIGHLVTAGGRTRTASLALGISRQTFFKRTRSRQQKTLRRGPLPQ